MLPGTHDSIDISSFTKHFELKLKGSGSNTICSKLVFNGFFDLTFEDMLVENMIIWVKAFIHKTYNYIYGYESLEFLGDKICSTKFTIYTVVKYPRLTPTELSEYHNQYMSSDHQWYLSDDLHLLSFILADPDVSLAGFNYVKRKTDIFEAFVRALYQTSLNGATSISGSAKKGMSFAENVTYNLFLMIGEQFPFEKKMIFGKSKHRITQIFQSLDIPIGKDDFEVRLREDDKGTANAKSRYFFNRSEKVIATLNKAREITGKDITKILEVSYTYIPQYVDKETGEGEFWNRVSKVFEENNFTILDAKNVQMSFMSMLSVVNGDLYEKVKRKLSLTYPDVSPEILLQRIQFQSTTSNEEEGCLPYVLMYFHTFTAEPDSKLLISFSSFDDLTQTSGDDYLYENTNNVQITNLSCVPMPMSGSMVGEYNLNRYNLAQYNCCLKYTTS